MMASATLEGIIERLLVPNNDVIQQATKNLAEAFHDSNIVPALCECLTASKHPQVRQYAAVLMQQHLGKLWRRMSQEDKASMKQLILGALCDESQPDVRQNIAQLIAAVGKRELLTGGWDELYSFIESKSVSSQTVEREVALLLLTILLKSDPGLLETKLTWLFELFATTLSDNTTTSVPYLTIKCLTSVAGRLIRSDHLASFQSLIPTVLQVLRAMVVGNKDHVCEAMEFFDDLLEFKVPLPAAMLSSLIEFLLEVAQSDSLADCVRKKAFSSICIVVENEKSAISSENVLATVLATVLTVLSAENDDHSMDGTNDGDRLGDAALEVLEILAVNIDSARFYGLCVQMVEPWLSGESLGQLKAAIWALAFISEGCSDYILKSGQVEALLEHVCRGLQHPTPGVRKAALFAIQEFSKDLKSGVKKFANSLIPIILDNLLNIGTFTGSQDKYEHSLMQYCCVALEEICKILGKDLAQFLPAIMERVFQLYSQVQGLAVKIGTLSILETLVREAKEQFLPYFHQAVTILDQCLSQPGSQSTDSTIQCDAISALAALSKTLGRSAPEFQPLLPKCIQIGRYMCENSDDPDLRGAVYNMIAALSGIKKELTEDHHVIITKMLEALPAKADDTKVRHNGSEFEGNQCDPIGRYNSDSGTDLFDPGECGSEEDHTVQEMTAACLALGALAENTGMDFLLYFCNAFEKIHALHLTNADEEARETSAMSLKNLSEVGLSLWEQLSAPSRVALTTLLNAALKDLASIGASRDVTKEVATTNISCTQDILDACKGCVELEAATAVAIMRACRKLLRCSVANRDCDELFESAGLTIAALVDLAGAPHFVKDLRDILTALLEQMQASQSSTPLRSLTVFAHLLESMGPECIRLPCAKILRQLNALAGHHDADIRGYAVFGVGVLASNAHPVVSPHYGLMLQKLVALAEREPDPFCQDTIVGAICRMITANRLCVPLDRIVPFLLRKLPLSESEYEHKAVYRCLSDLVQLKHPVVLESTSLGRILQMIAADWGRLDGASQRHAREMVAFLAQNCVHELRLASVGLSQDQIEVLQTALS